MLDIQLGIITRIKQENQTITIKSNYDGSEFSEIPLGNTSNMQTFPKVGAPVLFYHDTNGSATRIIKVWDVDIEKNRNLIPGEVQIQSGSNSPGGRAYIYLDSYGNVQITDGLMQDTISIDNEDGLIETSSNKLLLSTRKNVKIQIDEFGKMDIIKYDPTGAIELAKIEFAIDGTVNIESSLSINVKGLNVNVEATGNIQLGDSTGLTTRKLIDDRICAVFNGHMHVATSIGAPTSAPIIPFQITALPFEPLKVTVATQKVKGK